MTLREVLAALPPIQLPAAGDESGVPSLWVTEMREALGRLGKQQMRAAQELGAFREGMETELQRLGAALVAANEQVEEHRQEVSRGREGGWRRAEHLLQAIDAIDDLVTVALQLGEPMLIDRAQRLSRDVIRVFGETGIVEVPAVGVRFDEETHYAAEAQPATGEHRPGEVIALVRRGFRMDGQLLRRALVITAQ